MPRYRNISDGELYLPHVDRSVKPDEVVEVPDDDMVWPETLWAPVPKSKSNKDD